ncbi:MAG: DUF2911 domain-containing protein [Flavobacteriales bacterium]|nr:DUF2911 domain-containing protein [Flavobacteriales bacterium]
MKTFSALMLGPLLPLFLNAQDLPKPSPPGKVEQQVGLTQVVIEYNRPSAKGRKVFGDLVPYGELWRTGANLNSMISFDTDVRINGVEVKAGKYSLFTEPNESAWRIYLNRRTDLWGTDEFKQEEVVLTTKAPVQTNMERVETLTITIRDVVKDRAIVRIAWENVNVEFEIEADCTEKALANIEVAMKDPKADYRTYHNSARFCLDRSVKLDQALKWAQKSVQMEEKYWNVHTLALVMAANGKMDEAIAMAQRSMDLAQQAGDQGYVKMNKMKMVEWREGR